MVVGWLRLSPSGVIAWPSQGDDEDRDVIPGTQLVVGKTPASVPWGAPGPQDQSLGQSCIPARSTHANLCTNMCMGRQIHRPICRAPNASLCPSFASAIPSPPCHATPTCLGHWAHKLTAPCQLWWPPHSHW